jgi:hypothetical protein
LPENWSTLTVPVTTLDALAEAAAYDPGRVGLVWIDAENHEAQILDGASELTSRGVPALFELDPPGLEARGNVDLLCAIVEEYYTHFAKMRAETRAGHARYELRPANEIRELCASQDHFTDVLVLRLEKQQVPTAGLSAVLRSQSNLAQPSQPADSGPVNQKLMAPEESSSTQEPSLLSPDPAC